MHAASVHKSERLQRVLHLLQWARDIGKPWLSTRFIVQHADVCAVNSCIAELRSSVNGFNVECRKIGKSHFEYRITE